jgi:hypothetical protein
MHRIKASVLAGMALALCVACSDDEATTPEPITGTYQLSDADGETLPALIFDGLIADPDGDFVLRVLVDEGSLELSAGQRYEQRVTRSIFVDGHAQPGGLWNDRGTYTLGHIPLHQVAITRPGSGSLVGPSSADPGSLVAGFVRRGRRPGPGQSDARDDRRGRAPLAKRREELGRFSARRAALTRCRARALLPHLHV